MSAAWRSDLLAFWLMGASICLDYAWYCSLDKSPAVPQSFAIWFVNLSGAKNAEEIARAELVFGLAVFFVLVSLFTLAAFFLCRRARTDH